MDYSTIEFEINDHVASITLNRPEKYNALNPDMAKELMHAAIHCEENKEIRAVLLKGNGKTFSVGGDLNEFASQAENLPSFVKENIIYLHTTIIHMTRMDPPWVAAVHGNVAGAGMSLMCAADITLAAESATFSLAYTAIGLSPSGSSTHFLPRILGIKRAMELALTNRRVSAAEALEWGLVTRVVPDDALLELSNDAAIRLAKSPTKALGAAKQLLYQSVSQSLESQMENEAQAFTTMVRTNDFREGLTAFFEKREAIFRGD